MVNDFHILKRESERREVNNIIHIYKLYVNYAVIFKTLN